MAEKVNLTIDGIDISVDKGCSVLDAARQANIKIPVLCHHPDINVAGNCRVCVVEQIGARTLPVSCATPAVDGMEILTNSHKVRSARKHIIELLLSEHNADCTKCYKNGKCELQELAAEYKISNDFFIDLVPLKNYSIDKYSPSIIKDDSKCVRCQRCVRVCEELQSVSAISCAHKGDKMKVSTFFEHSLFEVVCTNCGQCINRCPTGALVEKNCIEEVWTALSDTTKHVVVQTAPAVRVALGEDLGNDPGVRVTGKMVAALKRLGFDAVLDTDFTADLTIMEEGFELLGRLKKAVKEKDHTVALPLTTSCSPGWIKFVEHIFPDMLDNVSTCKSPQQMFGALVKTYYAQKRGIDPANIISVSIMPCTAKKFEADRPEMRSSGYKDVDYVLTTRELAIMIKQAGIEFSSLQEENYDSIMGTSTGAAVIFGATGGVMEAALRTAWEVVTGKEIPFEGLNVTPVRGMEGIKEASVVITGTVPGVSSKAWN
jgi:NADP-reducing hydrogenase subunit HndD